MTAFPPLDIHPDAELQLQYTKNADATGHDEFCRRRVVPTITSDSRALDVERCERCRYLAGKLDVPVAAFAVSERSAAFTPTGTDEFVDQIHAAVAAGKLPPPPPEPGGRPMRVRVAYTITVDDDYRRAINLYYGKPGLASRQDVVDWHKAHGSCEDDVLMYDLGQARERGEEPEETS